MRTLLLAAVPILSWFIFSAIAADPPKWEFGKEVTVGEASVILIPEDSKPVPSFSVGVRGSGKGADHALVMVFYYVNTNISGRITRVLLHEEHMAPIAGPKGYGASDFFHLRLEQIEFIRVQFFKTTDEVELGRVAK